jgi:hypothetical protein
MASLTSIALSGLQSATQALDTSATRIAQASADLQTPADGAGGGADAAAAQERQAPAANDARAESRLDQTLVSLSSQQPPPDLGRELINQTVAAAAYKANLVSLQTADQTQGALADLKT